MGSTEPIGRALDADEFDFQALPHRCTKCKTNFRGSVEYMNHDCMECGWLPSPYTAEHGQWLVKVSRDEIDEEYIKKAEEIYGEDYGI